MLYKKDNTVHQIVFYTKTYYKDIERIRALLNSIKKYNKDSIPVYISIPKSDESYFQQEIQDPDIFVVFDEEIISNLNLIGNINALGWISQQIIKSNFWNLGVCKNYLMIDSDSYFIKDFYISDFMYDENTPYTVMHEQKDLFEWSSRYQGSHFDPKVSYEEDRRKIMKTLDRTGKVFDFGPSPVIWSCEAWKAFQGQFLNTNNLTFEQLIKYCASEFTWYGEFILKTNVIKIIPISPLFKVFHYSDQHEFYKKLGFTEEMFSKNYFGIVMQSNWSNGIKY